MNILFVSALLPYPLYSGGQIRVYNLLKHLGARHRISLCSFVRREEEKQWLKQLSFCQSVDTVYRGNAWQPRYLAAALLGRYPLLFATYANRIMADVLSKHLKERAYDVIHIEPGYVWPSIPATSLPLVVAEHNIEHTIYESYVASFPIVPARPLLYSDVLKLRYWETYVWKHASHVVAVSDEDRDMILRHRSSDSVSVVPNGVDTEHIRPDKKKNASFSKKMLFVGNFSWIQNRDAVRWLVTDIWPRIVASHPEFKLIIVGRGMPSDLKRLLDTKTTDLLEHVEDIRQQYAVADMLLAPIRIGGGTKFKVLEAMAAGLPVITTKEGALGLDVVNKKHLTIAASPDDFLQHVNELMINKHYRTTIVRNARLLVEKSYDWKNIASELEHVWQKVYEKSH